MKHLIHFNLTNWNHKSDLQANIGKKKKFLGLACYIYQTG